jgi:hypothetical protein
MKENEFLIKPLNSNLDLNDDKNQWIFCPIDCSKGDVCDDCDGICHPRVK